LAVVVGLALAGPAFAQTPYTWTNNSGLGVWSTNNADWLYGGVNYQWTNGWYGVFDNTATPGTVGVDPNGVTASGITFNAAGYTIGNTGYMGAISLGNYGITANASATTTTINSPITFAPTNSQTYIPISVAQGASLNLAGSIGDGNNGYGLTKAGQGLLSLSGAGNSYTGTTTISAGTLQLSTVQPLTISSNFNGSTVLPTNFAGYGTAVNGYQDTFQGSTLNSGWQVVGGGSAYSVGSGYLQVTGGPDPNHLIYAPTGLAGSTNWNVLALVQVNSVGNRAGICVDVPAAGQANSPYGINSLLRSAGSNDNGQGGLVDQFLYDYKAWGNALTNPDTSKFQWTTGGLYWMRLIGSGNNQTAEIWPADGHTPESQAATGTWNGAGNGANTGYAGISADVGGSMANMNVYYALIQNSSMSQILAGLQGSASAHPLPANSPVLINVGAVLDLNGSSAAPQSLNDYTTGAGGTVTNTSTVPATLTMTPPSGGATFSGSVTNGAGGIGLVVNGPGTQTFNGATSFSGGTTITAGGVALGSNASYSTGNLAISGGGTLNPGSKTISVTGLNLTAPSGQQATITGTAPFQISGGNTLTSALSSLGGDTLTLNGGITTVSMPNAAPTNGLTNEWTFNNTANDAVGTSNANLGNNTLLSSGGKFAGWGAVQVTSTNIVTMGVNGILPAYASGNQSRTISAWVEMQTPYPGDWKGDFIGFQNNSSHTSFYFDHVGGAAEFTVYNGDWGTGLADSGNWHMLTATYDSGSNNINVYIDGKINTTQNVGTLNITDYFGINLNDRNNLNVTENDVRVYNRALSAAEVQQLYNWDGMSTGFQAPTTTVNVTSGSTLSMGTGPWASFGQLNLAAPLTLAAGVSNIPAYFSNVNATTTAGILSDGNGQLGVPTTGIGVASQQTLTIGAQVVNNTSNGVLLLNGPGTVVLTNQGNSFSGGSSVTGGTLRLNSAGGTPLGSGPLMVGGGALHVASAATITNNINVQAGGQIGGNGLLTFSTTPIGSGVGTLTVGNSFSSDATSGISSSNTYTEAIAFNAGSNITVNGVTFTPSPAENGKNVNGTGTQGTSWNLNGGGNNLGTAGGTLPSPFTLASGGMTSVLTNLDYNGNPGTFTLSGLTPGATYDTRVYYRSWGNPSSDRFVTLSFNAGGATQSQGVNEDANANANYVDYQYTVGSGGTMQIVANPQNPGNTWHWYGLTNQYISAAQLPSLNVLSGGTLAPSLGNSSATTTMTVAGPVNINAGAILNYNLAASNGSDQLLVTGAGNTLTLGAGADTLNLVNLDPGGLSNPAGTYIILAGTNSATLNDQGAAGNWVVANTGAYSFYKFTVSDPGNNEVVLSVKPAVSSSRFWEGANGSNWDNDVSANWQGASYFFNYDSATFDDTHIAIPPKNNVVNVASGTVAGTVTFANTNIPYTLQGSALTADSITVNGGGNVTLNNANTLNLGFTISSGTLSVGTQGSLAAGYYSITGATSQLNLLGNGAVAGNLTLGSGASMNVGLSSAGPTLTVAGTATINGNLQVNGNAVGSAVFGTSGIPVAQLVVSGGTAAFGPYSSVTLPNVLLNSGGSLSAAGAGSITTLGIYDTSTLYVGGTVNLNTLNFDPGYTGGTTLDTNVTGPVTLSIPNGTVTLNYTNQMTTLTANGSSVTTLGSPNITTANVNNSASLVFESGSTAHIPTLNYGSSATTSVPAGAVVGNTLLNASNGTLNLANVNTIPTLNLSGGAVNMTNAAAAQTITTANVTGAGALAFAAGNNTTIPTLNYGSSAALNVPATVSVGSNTLSIAAGNVTMNNTNPMPNVSITGGTVALPTAGGQIASLSMAGALVSGTNVPVTGSATIGNGQSYAYTPVGGAPAFGLTGANLASAAAPATLTFGGGTITLNSPPPVSDVHLVVGNAGLNTSQDSYTAPANGNPAGTWTLHGVGADLWAPNERGEFVYRTASSGFDVMTYVSINTAVGYTDAWSRCGIMACPVNPNGATAPFVSMDRTGGAAYMGLWSSNADSGGGNAWTGWVRMSYNPATNNFTGWYDDTDGPNTIPSASSNWQGNWTYNAPNIGTTFDLGLIDSSHSDGNYCEATYTNFLNTPGSGSALGSGAVLSLAGSFGAGQTTVAVTSSATLAAGAIPVAVTLGGLTVNNGATLTLSAPTAGVPFAVSNITNTTSAGGQIVSDSNGNALLAGPVGTLTVSNVGPLVIGAQVVNNAAGASALLKTGPGALVLQHNLNSYSGGTTVGGGMLALDSLASNSTPAGSGPITVLNTGTLSIGWTNGNGGNAQPNVNDNVTVQLGGTIGGPGTLTINNNKTLTVQNGGIVAPSLGVPGINTTLAVNGNVTLNPGAVLTFNYPAALTSDTLDVLSGTLTLSSGASPYVVTIPSTMPQNATGWYELLQTDNGSATLNDLIPANKWATSWSVNPTADPSYNYSFVLTGGDVFLDVATGAPISTWNNSTASGRWASSGNDTGNFTATYADGNKVKFTNAAAGTVQIAAAGVAPYSVTFNNDSTAPYTIIGGPIMDGATPTTLGVQGGGTVTLNQTNSFQGTTGVSNGSTLIIGPGGGLSSNVITVDGTSVLNVSGSLNLPLLTGGTNMPALADSGAATFYASNALGTVTGPGSLAVRGAGTVLTVGSLGLGGNVSVNDTSTLNVTNAAGMNNSATLNMNGAGAQIIVPNLNGFTGTISGAGTLAYNLGGGTSSVPSGATLSYTGPTVIGGGAGSLFQASVDSNFGAGAGGITIKNATLEITSTTTYPSTSRVITAGDPAATLQIDSGTFTVNTSMQAANGGGLTVTGNGNLTFGPGASMASAAPFAFNTGGTLDLGGNTHQPSVLSLRGGTLQNGTLGGPGGLLATAGSSVVLSSVTNNFGGGTSISGGTLNMGGVSLGGGPVGLNGGLLSITLQAAGTPTPGNGLFAQVYNNTTGQNQQGNFDNYTDFSSWWSFNPVTGGAPGAAPANNANTLRYVGGNLTVNKPDGAFDYNQGSGNNNSHGYPGADFASLGLGSLGANYDNQNFDVVFSGKIYLGQTGTYNFHADGDDGASMYVNNTSVCYKGNGSYNVTAPGWYPIEIGYFQYGGGFNFNAQYQLPGSNNWLELTNSMLMPSVTSTAAAYNNPVSLSASSTLDVQPGSVYGGVATFGQLTVTNAGSTLTSTGSNSAVSFSSVAINSGVTSYGFNVNTIDMSLGQITYAGNTAATINVAGPGVLNLTGGGGSSPSGTNFQVNGSTLLALSPAALQGAAVSVNNGSTLVLASTGSSATYDLITADPLSFGSPNGTVGLVAAAGPTGGALPAAAAAGVNAGFANVNVTGNGAVAVGPGQTVNISALGNYALSFGPQFSFNSAGRVSFNGGLVTLNNPGGFCSGGTLAFSGGTVLANSAGVFPGPVIEFNGGTMGAQVANTLPNTLIWGSANQSVTFTGDGNLLFTNTLSLPNSGTTYSINDGLGRATFSGQVTGPGNLTLNGNATLANPNNNYSGTTTLNGGNTTIVSQYGLGTGAINFNGGSVGSTIPLTGALAVTNAWSSNNGWAGLEVNGNNTVEFTQGTSFNDQRLALNCNPWMIVDGPITNGTAPANAPVVKQWGGMLTLRSQASTFTGGLQLAGGQGTIDLPVSSIGPAGAPTSGPAGTGTIATGYNYTPGWNNWNGGWSWISIGNITGTQPVTIANPVAAEYNCMYDGGTAGITFSGPITMVNGGGGWGINQNLNMFFTHGNVTFSGAINDNGNGCMFFLGSGSNWNTGGALTLSGANTFSGGVLLNEGTLIAANPTALGPSSNLVTMNKTDNGGVGTWDNPWGYMTNAGVNETDGHTALLIAGGNTVPNAINVTTFNNGWGANPTYLGAADTSSGLAFTGQIGIAENVTLVAPTGGTVTFGTLSTGITGSGGVIAGAAPGAVNYNGTVVLNGLHTYTGGTTVAYGSLLLGGGTIGGSSGVTVNAGATLGSLADGTTGSITPAVVVNGTLAPGWNSPMQISSLTLNAGSTFALTGKSGQVSEVYGINTLNLPSTGTVNLQITPLDNSLNGGTFTFLTGPGVTSSAATWNIVPKSSITWTSTNATGYWDALSNWSGYVVQGGSVAVVGNAVQVSGLTVSAGGPSAGADIYIQPTSGVVVTGPTSAATATVNSLTLGNASGSTDELDLPSAANSGYGLNVTGAAGVVINPTGLLNVSGGSLTVSGPAAVLGSASFNAASSVTLPSVTVSGNGQLSALGTGTVGLSLAGNFAGTVTLGANITGPTTLTVPGGTVNLYDDGTHMTSLVLNGGITTLGSQVVNSATVSGAAALAFAATSTAQIPTLTYQSTQALSVPSAVQVGSNSLTVSSGSVTLLNTNAMGTVAVSGGTVNFNPAGVTIATATFSGEPSISLPANGTISTLNYSLYTPLSIPSTFAVGGTALTITSGSVTLANVNPMGTVAVSGGTANFVAPSVNITSATFSGAAVVSLPPLGTINTLNYALPAPLNIPATMSVGSTALSINNGLVTLNNTNPLGTVSVTGGTLNVATPSVNITSATFSAGASVSLPSVGTINTLNYLIPAAYNIPATMNVGSTALAINSAAVTLNNTNPLGTVSVTGGTLNFAVPSVNINSATFSGSAVVSLPSTGTINTLNYLIPAAYNIPATMNVGSTALAVNSAAVALGNTNAMGTVSVSGGSLAVASQSINTLNVSSTLASGSYAGLERHFVFNNGTAADVSGNNGMAALQYSAVVTTSGGKYSTGYLNLSSDPHDYLRIGNDANSGPVIGNNYTLTCWYMDAGINSGNNATLWRGGNGLGNGLDGDHPVILNNTAGLRNQLGIYANGSGVMYGNANFQQASLNGAAATLPGVDANGNSTDNAWHFLAVVDNNGMQTFYTNNGNSLQVLGTLGHYMQPNQWLAGLGGMNDWQQRFALGLDDAYVYNTALGADQLTNVMNESYLPAPVVTFAPGSTATVNTFNYGAVGGSIQVPAGVTMQTANVSNGSVAFASGATLSTLALSGGTVNASQLTVNTLDATAGPGVLNTGAGSVAVTNQFRLSNGGILTYTGPASMALSGTNAASIAVNNTITLSGGTVTATGASPSLVAQVYNDTSGQNNEQNNIGTWSALTNWWPNNVSAAQDGLAFAGSGRTSTNPHGTLLYVGNNNNKGAVSNAGDFGSILGQCLGANGDDQEFDVVLSGRIYLGKAGTYTFGLNSDDGSMLYINGQQVVNSNWYKGWNGQGNYPQTGTYTVTTPGLYQIVVPYYQGGGGYNLEVGWQAPGAASMTDIPNSMLFGPGPLSLPNAAINVTASSTLAADNFTPAANYGALTVNNGSTLSLTAAVAATPFAFNGITSNTGGTVTSDGNAQLVLTGPVGAANGATLTIGATVVNGTTATSLVVNGTGSGTVVLTSNANAYTGGTTINSGVLQYGDGTANVNPPDNLSGKIILDNGQVNFANPQPLSLACNISGTGSLRKLGGGVLTIPVPQSYTGATTVNAGTLEVNTTLASSLVTVNNTATLAGNATLQAVTVNAGGTLSPGTLATLTGTLAVVNTLTLNSGATISVQTTPDGTGLLGSVSAANLTIAAGATEIVNVTAASNPQMNTAYPIITVPAGGTVANFSGVTWKYTGPAPSVPGSSQGLWNGSALDNNWDNPANWTGLNNGVIPTITLDTSAQGVQTVDLKYLTGPSAPQSNTNVSILPAGATMTVTGPSLVLANSIASLTLGDASAGTATLTMSAGSLTVTNGGSGATSIAANGILLVGPGAGSFTTDQLSVAGSVGVTGGNSLTVTSAAGATISGGSITVSGNGSALNAASLALNSAGSVFNLLSGAASTIGDLNVSAGTATLAGASLNLATAEVAGTMNLSAGSIGSASISGGNLNQSGGTIATASLDSFVGGTLTATAGYIGTLNVPAPVLGTATANLQGATVGSAVLSGGSTTLTAGTMSGGSVSGAAILTASGGTVSALSIDPAYTGTMSIGPAATGPSTLLVPNGTVNLFNQNQMSSLTLTGGITTLGNGSKVTTLTGSGGNLFVDNSVANAVVTVGTLDLSSPTAPVANTQTGSFAITNAMLMGDGTSIAGRFGISGASVGNNSSVRTLSLASGGVVTLGSAAVANSVALNGGSGSYQISYVGGSPVWTVNGQGGDMWGGQEQSEFVFKNTSSGGAFNVMAYVNITQPGPDNWTKCGLMAAGGPNSAASWSTDGRNGGGNNNADGGPFLFMAATSASGHSYQWSDDNPNQNANDGAATGNKCWVRLAYDGAGNMTGYYSDQASGTPLSQITWVPYGPTYQYTFPSNGEELGLMVTSHNGGQMATAQFTNVDNINANGTFTPLMGSGPFSAPATAVAVTGSTTLAAGTATGVSLGALTVNNSAVLTLSSANAATQFTFGNVSTTTGGGLAADSSGNSQLVLTGTASAAGGQTLNIGLPVVDPASGGTTGLVVGGNGTVRLSAANTFSGGATINTGATLQVGNGQTGSMVDSPILNNGLLAYALATASTVGANGSITGSGGLVQYGPGALTLADFAAEYTGGTTLKGGSLGFTPAAFAAGGVAGVAGAIVSDPGNGQSDSLVWKNLSNNLSVVPLDPTSNGNSLTLSSGTTMLSFQNEASNNPVTFAGAVAGTGAMEIASGGTLQVGSFGNTAGPALLGNVSSIVLDSGSVLSVADTGSIKGSIKGAGGLLAQQSGIVVLTAPNSYQGGTTVAPAYPAPNAGSQLVAENANALPSGGLLTIGYGGSVVLGAPGYAETTGAVGGGAPLSQVLSAAPVAPAGGAAAGGAAAGGAAPVAGTVNAVPEPGTIALLAAAAGCGLVAAYRRRRGGRKGN
jgi:autotransporter-associated beta strand protein